MEKYKINYTNYTITITAEFDRKLQDLKSDEYELIQRVKAEACLKEILIRELALDVQINAYDFACFLTAFSDIEGFESMPWGERESALSKTYGVNVSERTLRNWCARLIQRNMICANGDRTCWRTEIFEGIKYRSRVTQEDYGEMRDYFNRRRELVAAEYQNALSSGISVKDAKQQAWGHAYKQLWPEYQCCYYSCKGFQLNAFSELEQETMFEIFELTRELAGTVPAEAPFENNREDDFYAEWYGK